MKKIIIFFLASSLLIVSCGKKGAPVYKEKSQLISIQS